MSHQPRRSPMRFMRRPAPLVVEPRDLAIEPIPVDLVGKMHQLVLHVDDLLKPRPEQIDSILSSCASSAASSPPMRRQDHACALRPPRWCSGVFR
jgi:hypothetical protein